MLEAAGGLKPGEAMIWVSSTETFERVQFPMATVFDSGARPKHGEKARTLLPLKMDLGDLQAALDAAGVQVAVDSGELEKLVQSQAAEIRALHEQADQSVEFNQQLVQENERLRMRVTNLVAAIKLARSGLYSAVANIEGEEDHVDVTIQSYDRPVRARDPAPVTHVPAPAKIPAPASEPAELPVQPRHAKIARAILWCEVVLKNSTPERHLVAFMAGVSPKSSSYANDLGWMRTNGLVDYPASGQLCLTEEGRGIAGGVDRSTDPSEILDAICAQLDPRHQDMLRHLAACYPRMLSRDDLANLCGKSATSSSFANDLGFLKNTIKAITYPRQGAVALADFVMGK